MAQVEDGVGGSTARLLTNLDALHRGFEPQQFTKEARRQHRVSFHLVSCGSAKSEVDDPVQCTSDLDGAGDKGAGAEVRRKARRRRVRRREEK